MKRQHGFTLWHAQRGLTLVELMIAMLLGLVLSAAIIQVFLSTKNVHRMQADLARIQENGRFATEILSRDIRMAGYSGCGNIARVSVNVIASPPSAFMTFDSDTFISGLDNAAAGNALGAKAGTDVIELRGAAAGGVRLYPEKVMNANVKIDGNPYGFKPGDTLMVTDCVNADVFNAVNVSQAGGKVTITHSQSGNTSNFLSKAYGSDAEMLFYQALTYYVKPSGRTTAAGRSIDSLWVRIQGANIGSVAQDVEVVEGVEDLQIQYGIDTTGNRAANEFRAADAGLDWSRVVSVRFSLLMAGHGDNIVSSSGDFAQALEYNGATLSGSGALRDVFENVVAIRNRIP